MGHRLVLGVVTAAALLGCSDDAVPSSGDSGESGDSTGADAEDAASAGVSTGGADTTTGAAPGDEGTTTSGVAADESEDSGAETSGSSDDGSSSGSTTGEECVPLDCSFICDVQADPCGGPAVDCGSCGWSTTPFGSSDVYSAAVAVDPDGTPHAAWVERTRPGNLQVVYATWVDGAFVPEVVQGVGGDTASVFDELASVDLEVDEDGQPHLAFLSNDELRAGVLTDDGWILDTAVASGVQLGIDASLGSDGLAIAYVDAMSTLWIATPDGNDWVSTVVDAEGGPARLARDGAGDLYAAYVRGLVMPELVIATEGDDGWEHTVLDDSVLVHPPAITFDDADRMHVLAGDDQEALRHWVEEAPGDFTTTAVHDDFRQGLAMTRDEQGVVHALFESLFDDFTYASVDGLAGWLVDIEVSQESCGWPQVDIAAGNGVVHAMIVCSSSAEYLMLPSSGDAGG